MHPYTQDTHHHCMEIVQKTAQLLSPCQVCVDESDQPVYKLLKEPNGDFLIDLALRNIFVFFVSLHIEKSILLLCSSLIEGSGVDEIMASFGLSTTDFLVSVNHIKKSRYCIQLCHVLTVNISPWRKWWKSPCTAMVTKSKWRKWNVSLLVHNHRLDVKSFDFC